MVEALTDERPAAPEGRSDPALRGEPSAPGDRGDCLGLGIRAVGIALLAHPAEVAQRGVKMLDEASHRQDECEA